MQKRYSFWNNKGGTGKTSLAFQAILGYAEKNRNKKILVIDACPQANISELFLGGIDNNGSNNLLKVYKRSDRCSIGGYFQLRIPSPFSCPTFDVKDYIISPSSIHGQINGNIDLVCGDPLLELQSNAINTLANTSLPGINTWAKVIDWINDFIEKTGDEYNTIFFDCNPSFSLYTQIALASSGEIIIPMMADDSSRRAVQNALSLIYGLCLPSPIYSEHNFAKRISELHRDLPKVHLIVKNRITQYMGPASAYAAMLNSIDNTISDALKNNPHFFSFATMSDSFVEIRDFQTTGVVAYAKGLPFSKVSKGRQQLIGRTVQVKKEYLQNCREDIEKLVAKL